MTPEQSAVFSVTNDMYMWFGIILGLLISGFFKTLISFLTHRIQRPRRIVLRNLNGKTEKGTSQEYLYLFKNEYYTLEHRDFLIKQRIENFKRKPRLFSPLELIFVFSLLLLAVIYFSMIIQNYRFGI